MAKNENKDQYMKALSTSFQNKDWFSFSVIAFNKDYGVMCEAFKLYYDKLPDDKKYGFALHAYVHGGNNYPIVRKAVRNALKYKINDHIEYDLPPELTDADEIEIYRAGEEPITTAKYRMSWTTSINIARYYYYEINNEDSPKHLYKGKIKPEHVIAYYDRKNDQEIVQYRHVYDIEEISPDSIG